MRKTELHTIYEERKAAFSASLASITRKINTISNLRLAVAILFVVFLYLGLTQSYDLLYLLIPVLAAFVLLMRKHSALFDERIRLQNLKRIQEDEISALHGDFSHNSAGSEFIDIHHPYTHDLDIFGEGSVFQYLNRSNTRGGKKLLADRLSGRAQNKSEAIQWQEAIKELARRIDFRHEVQALSMQIEEQAGDERQLEQWLSQPSFVYGKRPYQAILTIFPILTLTLVLAAVFLEGFTGFAVLAAGLQWAFLGFHLKKVNAFHQYISGKKTTLEKYARMLYFVQQGDYTSQIMQSLAARSREGDLKVRQLSTLMSAFDARFNSMTNLVVNSLLLYDLQCVYRLEKWKEDNASHLPGWLAAIHEAEVLNSMATFSYNHPGFAFPVISTDLRLSGKDVGHPLLPDNERVNNDLHLDERHSIMIITGANMAGKSTFLRALGVNVVLALSGGPVCATEFYCPLIDIRSGMRTADSLKEHQSYFYAELDRLKSIMDGLRQGTPLLILLDEILKGTNSADKQAGSVALVKQLISHRCIALIATHDLALGDLEEDYPGKVQNYSFEANIENEQLFFDYKLKRGRAQKMNATFLMRKMGIIGPASTG